MGGAEFTTPKNAVRSIETTDLWRRRRLQTTTTTTTTTTMMMTTAGTTTDMMMMYFRSSPLSVASTTSQHTAINSMLTRDIDIAMSAVCLSFCLSVTFRYCIENGQA